MEIVNSEYLEILSRNANVKSISFKGESEVLKGHLLYNIEYNFGYTEIIMVKN